MAVDGAVGREACFLVTEQGDQLDVLIDIQRTAEVLVFRADRSLDVEHADVRFGDEDVQFGLVVVCDDFVGAGRDDDTEFADLGSFAGRRPFGGCGRGLGAGPVARGPLELLLDDGDVV